jgi:chitosanase
MFTEQQKNAAQAVINIFETGRAQGEYGQVTVLPGDSGHLTYGRSQTTLGSGNLYLLIKEYCETANAQFAAQLRPYLERLRNHDTSG